MEATARPYQLQLADYLYENNGILYLPTGAGKTFVAILVLKRFSSQLQQTVREGGKRTLFLCNTVELARQQCKEIRKSTNLKVGIYVGERGVDNWQQRKWSQEIDENQVLVGTVQIFVDIVSQHILKVSDINLVIIDECHHTTKNHPMHAFLNLIHHADQSQIPRIVGLTGVLIKSSKYSEMHKALTSLEACFRGNIVTVTDMDNYQNVLTYSTKPKEGVITYNSHNHTFKAEEKVLEIVNECKTVIDNFDIGSMAIQVTKNLNVQREPNRKKAIKNRLDDFIYQMKDLGLYMASLAILNIIIEFEIKRNQSETVALRNLYRHTIKCCEHIRHIVITELKASLDEADDQTDDSSDHHNSKDQIGQNILFKDSSIHTLDIIYNYSKHKLRALLLYLKSTFGNKNPDDIACLVFVQRRYAAKCIYHALLHFIKNTPELCDVIKPQFMIGGEQNLYKVQYILDAKWNKDAMEQFRNKQCNLIICSSVLEEGIDLPACNYVLILDELQTFQSYIQTKGRARAELSQYVVFCSDIDKLKMCNRIQAFKTDHERIRAYLSTRLLQQSEPSKEEIDEQFTDIIAPLQIHSGAILLASSALALIHRYCVNLPCDSFGPIMPWFKKLPPTSDGKVAVSLQLPLQSTVKETIISDYMDNIKNAKISASFKACKLLYENGELNEQLLPVTKEQCLRKVTNELFEHWKKYRDDASKTKIGKTHCRLYGQQTPDELYNSMPEVGRRSYAYIIHYGTELVMNDYNAHIIKYLNMPQTYGILLKKQLPRLAEMPLFMSQGKISVRIEYKPIECRIESDEQLEKLRAFHTMIFRDLLEIWKEFYVMDRRNRNNSFLIVPMDEQNLCIDWQIVNRFQRLQPNHTYSLKERQNLCYKAEDYLDKVVSKWYNQSENERYIVTKVRTDLTPLSPFGNSQYASYDEFFKHRYHIQTINKEQFLLEVKALTKRRNFFINAAGKSSTQIKKYTSDIYLIPELCHNYQYPAVLWLKALFLPTILHRLYYMLHAEVLRQRINNFLKLNKYFDNYQPHPLIIDASLKRAIDAEGNAINSEVFEKTPSYLPNITPKIHQQKNTNFEQKTGSLQSDNLLWKDYLEPVDIDRHLDSIYPIEVDYYQKFISGLLVDMKNLSIEESDSFWTESQLEKIVPVKKQTRNDLLIETFGGNAIEDVPKADRYDVKILKLGLSKDNELKSAEQYEFLAAITTAKVNDVFDMERFELLGDAFLKFSVSLYLANKYPAWNEGYLTSIKSRLVSNRNLLYCMMDMDICGKICASLFSPSITWLPPLISLPNNILELYDDYPNADVNVPPNALYSMELTEQEIVLGKCNDYNIPNIKEFIQHASDSEIAKEEYSEMNIFFYKEVLADKVIADTLEAILGVCVNKYGIQRTFRMLEFFNIVKPDGKVPLTHLLDLKLTGGQLRTNISEKEVDGFLINYTYLEKNLGYKFRDRAFLLQALTHPSYPTNRLTGCYQELEFIGDAILDMLVTCYLFERFQDKTPGMLTDLRSALVNNTTLGCICVRHRFHLYMLYENAALSEAIKRFADFQDTQGHRVTDKVRILMIEENDADNSSNDADEETNEDEKQMPVDQQNGQPITSNYNIADMIDVPKALGDVVEAIIAAVYLDCRDLEITWRVLYNLIETDINQFMVNLPIDPVRQLSETTTANAKYSKPFIDKGVCMVTCTFNCMQISTEVNGFGTNAKFAKKAAARAALRLLSRHSN